MLILNLLKYSRLNEKLLERSGVGHIEDGRVSKLGNERDDGTLKIVGSWGRRGLLNFGSTSYHVKLKHASDAGLVSAR